MYTARNVNTVLQYNKTANIFRITPAKRVVWHLRNMDVANLLLRGVTIASVEDFAKLKKQVRAELVLQKQL